MKGDPRKVTPSHGVGCVYKTNPNPRKSFQMELPGLKQQDKNTSGPPPSWGEAGPARAVSSAQFVAQFFIALWAPQWSFSPTRQTSNPF